MATLSDIAANVANQLSRSDLTTEIKTEIGSSIRRLNREVSHITEMRALELTTSAGVYWYGTVDASSGVGYGAAQSATMAVSNIVSVVYMRLSPGATGVNEPLTFKDYRYFEALREGSVSSGEPTFWTLYAGQIGLFPTPGEAYTIEISANVKPVVPTADAHTSVWFDEYPEIVESMAASRVYRKYLQDEERATAFDRIAISDMAALALEASKKVGSGRLRSRD